MKSKYYKATLAVAVCIQVVSCSGKENRNPYELAPDYGVEPVELVRLDTIIETYSTLDSLERVEVLDRYHDALLGFGMFADGLDSVTNDLVNLWSVWPATTAFMPEVRQQYTDLSGEERSIGKVLAGLKQNDIDVNVEKFVTVTWGRYNPVVVMDTLKTVYIALNHYLGPENHAYSGWPTYICALKTRSMMPVDVSEALVSTAMPYRPEGSGTVLSRILYEGARAVAKEALVPEASLTEILGLTPAALTITRQNENFMWNMLMKDNKLYSTDAELISNLFDVRANSTMISPDAPGRAVRLTGYNIVKSYLKNNPKTELKYLLSPEFYDGGAEVLRKAKYMPGE